MQQEITRQLESRRQEEAKILSKLKKNLVTKKSAMETDLRNKLESRKYKMLDSRAEEVKTEPGKEGSANKEVFCPFCSESLASDSLLLEHMKLKHLKLMFGCSKCSTSLQPAIAWSCSVLLSHLASQHKLNISTSEAMANYVEMPGSLHLVRCKLCPPPYLLGGEGTWVGRDLLDILESVEAHCATSHALTDRASVLPVVELACRACDVTFPSQQRVEWAAHVRSNHQRANRPSVRARASGPSKPCDYCGESVVVSEAVRHVKEQHPKETFMCKLCLTADPSCFPYADTVKEMTSHMVMKHPEVESYYDHMLYPLTLYGSLCSNKECESKGGKVLAFDAATIGRHLRMHQSDGGDEVGEFYCRCCDRVKERFKTIEEVKEHIGKRHKNIIKWKATNGHFSS